MLNIQGMEKAALRRLFQVPMLWGHASSGHTKTYDTYNSESAPRGQGHMFDYSDKDIGRLMECLSSDRLKPYLVKARGDEWVAFHLYARNMEISTSLYGVLHVLEVGLRNRVHTKMVEALQTEEWWDALPLHEQELNDIAEAKGKIAGRIQQVPPGRVVAEMNFGFWVKLFANVYEKEIWAPYLTHRFPAKISRKVLHERLLSVKKIRNRIAHHETLIGRDPKQDYAQMLETIGWISPTLRRWTEHHTDFPQVVERRIPKRAKADDAQLSDAAEA